MLVLFDWEPKLGGICSFMEDVMKTTEYLNCMRCIVKLHESMLKTVCRRYDLSNTQAAVISFLCNNPDKNTAAQISQLRMLSKGNISTAVDGLVEKGLMERQTDAYDRRSLRLRLTEAADGIVRDVEQIFDDLFAELTDGFSRAELRQFHALVLRLEDNAYIAMRRRKRHG